MKTIEITILGETPLLMNRFTSEAELSVSNSAKAAFRGNKGTPREQAEPKAYRLKDKSLFVPAINIFASIVAAGTFIKNGKSKMTTQKSSLVGAMVSMESIDCVLCEPKTKKTIDDFEVDCRSVVIPSTGGRIMAYRPRVDEWTTSFTLTYDETEIDGKLVRELVDIAGKKCGLGDYRPQKKGTFGRFKVIEWQEN